MKEAGHLPNAKQDAYDQEWLIEKLIEFIRELGRMPTDGELRLHAHNNDKFPSHTVFRRRLGRRAELVAKVIDYCARYEDHDDVFEICRSTTSEKKSQTPDQAEGEKLNFGYVYLFKSGGHYKIGHSNSAGRREYEVALQLPEHLTMVHTISTDDPVGIEAYWHKRFEPKRLNGEWFNLSATDIRAFKRRKFM